MIEREGGLPLPLENTVVLDLSEHVAGPYCTKILANYGAEVIKVEPPGSGDVSRRLGPFPGDEPHLEKSGLFLYLNTNKQSVTLNLDSSTGKQILQNLIERADIVVESLGPAALSRLGLDFPTPEGIRPGIVVVSISDFGQFGPYKDFKASHLVHCALGGWQYTGGDPDREPLQAGGLLTYYVTGLYGAIAALAAHYCARLTGIGRHIDLSTQEAMHIVMGYPTVRYWIDGQTRRRTGTHFPWAIFECRDGLVGCSVLGDDQWVHLCRFVEREDWLQDPRFATGPGRSARAQEIEAYLSSWFADKSKEELFHEGQAWRISFSLVPTVAELLELEQHRVREYFATADHPAAGTLTYPGPPFRLSETGWHLEPAPLLGQHNSEVYCDRLGYSMDDLARLRAQGVI